ncbi:MAG: hypothetical protein R8G66_11110 [Cytophagales bacterium]|nr:hypothetical protein [Cytophagales bacterium]
MRLAFSLLTLIFLFALISCSDDDPTFSCDDQAVISDSELDTAPRDAVTIQSLEIDGNCLKIRFSASGCDGDSWQVRLLGSELVMESFPPQRGMLLSLDNDELCEAVITREMTFDITSTEVDGPSIWLNFIDTDQRILYEYE